MFRSEINTVSHIWCILFDIILAQRSSGSIVDDSRSAQIIFLPGFAAINLTSSSID